eukprot:3021616-Pyramimonas_sp.AAC.1
MLYMPNHGWPPGVDPATHGRAAYLLTDMVNCGGIPGSDTAYMLGEGGDAALDRNIVRTFEEVGYAIRDDVRVAAAFGGTVEAWRLTEHAMADLGAFD